MSFTIIEKNQSNCVTKLDYILTLEFDDEFENLPFKEARIEVLRSLRKYRNGQLTFVRHTYDPEYVRYSDSFSTTTKHKIDGHIPKDYISKTIIPRILKFENEIKDQIKKDFNILSSELKNLKRMVEADIIEIIIIPNIIERPLLGSDIKNSLIETLL